MSLTEQREQEAQRHDNIVRQITALNEERLRLEGKVQLLDRMIEESMERLPDVPELPEAEDNGHDESLRERLGRTFRA